MRLFIYLVILFFLFKFLFQSFTYYYRIKILSDGINNFLTQNFLKFINFKPDILEKFNFFESNTILIKEIENVFMSFADKILEQEKVAVVPGEAFGAQGYMRLSYATSDETIENGLERIKRFCKSIY